MPTKLRMALRQIFIAVARRCGTRIVDERTGEPLGRAFFLGWNGRVLVIGLESEPPLRPHFLPQERLTYWKQEMGFSSLPNPDFPSLQSHDSARPPDASAAP